MRAVMPIGLMGCSSNTNTAFSGRISSKPRSGPTESRSSPAPLCLNIRLQQQ